MSDNQYMSTPELARENIYLTFKHVSRATAFSSSVAENIEKTEAILDDFYSDRSSLIINSRA